MSNIFNIKDAKEIKRQKIRDKMDNLLKVATGLSHTIADMRQIRGHDKKVRETRALFKHFKEEWHKARKEYDNLR